MGRSGGAPHALACAALLKDRVVAAAALGSLAPYDAVDLDWKLGMADSNIRAYRDASADPGTLIARLNEQARRSDSEGLLKSLIPELMGHDDNGIEPLRRMIAETQAEGLCETTDGWMDDIIALSRPWGFDLSEITAPVKLWAGSKDVFSPVSHTYWLAKRIDRAEVQIEQGKAHFGTVEILPQTLAWVAERANPVPEIAKSDVSQFIESRDQPAVDRQLEASLLHTPEPLRIRRRRVGQTERSSEASAVRAEEVVRPPAEILSGWDLGHEAATKQGHVFISYVSEDSKTVDRLQQDLRDAGINVWRDRTSLGPGDPWKDVIRRAISSGTYFICCFSEASKVRRRSYMNEELILAIEELRVRDRAQSWFLPVIFSGGEVPDWPIGAGESLRDFNYTPLFPDTWQDGVSKLVIAIEQNRH